MAAAAIVALGLTLGVSVSGQVGKGFDANTAVEKDASLP
jgi:hypothetical protein